MLWHQNGREKNQGVGSNSGGAMPLTMWIVCKNCMLYVESGSSCCGLGLVCFAKVMQGKGAIYFQHLFLCGVDLQRDQKNKNKKDKPDCMSHLSISTHI